MDELRKVNGFGTHDVIVIFKNQGQAAGSSLHQAHSQLI